MYTKSGNRYYNPKAYDYKIKKEQLKQDKINKELFIRIMNEGYSVNVPYEFKDEFKNKMNSYGINYAWDKKSTCWKVLTRKENLMILKDKMNYIEIL